jgi:hypothetical protein
LCRTNFDPGDPEGPLRELDYESDEARRQQGGGVTTEADRWEREP